MPLSSGIILLTRDEETRSEMLRVARSHSVPVQDTCHTSPQLALELERNPKAFAVVDIDPDPKRLLLELEPVIVNFPQTRFVAIGRDNDSELLRTCMEVGIRQYLPKVNLEKDLWDVLERLAAHERATSGGLGRLVTVLSCGGGCGSTMLALNLANELRLQEHRPSLLMDLDMDYGGASSYVGLRSNYTVADLLRHTGEIDAELISSSAQEFQDQLDILVSPAALDPLQSEGMDFGRVDAALEAAKIAYSNTVADSPRLPFDVLLKLAGLSEAALLIMQLTVKDLRLAALLLRRLQQAGIGRERVFAVVNRYRKRGHLVELSTARESLDGCSIFCVRNDFHNAIRSYDYGQPLAECAPRSPLRKDVAELAQRIKALPRLTRSYLASGET